MHSDLPIPVQKSLDDFVEAAKRTLGGDLKSVVLYGSGAEGRLRPTSDVNLILVLSAFDRARIDDLREPLRVAKAAINLAAMFLLEGEIADAAETFAVKFADVLRRRRVLFGYDPFEGLSISRQAETARLKQVLLNLLLRLRSSYAAQSLREEQLAFVIAEAAGPLRAAAGVLLELEGERPGSAKEALERVAATMDLPNVSAALACLSEAREKRLLSPGAGPETLLQLIDLAHRMRRRAEAL